MPMGIMFWVLMIILLVLGIVSCRHDLRSMEFTVAGRFACLFVLLFLLGWKVFGPLLQ